MLCFTATECGLFFSLVHVSIYENIQQNIHRIRSFVSLRDGYWPVFLLPFFRSFRPFSFRLFLPCFYHCTHFQFYFKLSIVTLFRDFLYLWSPFQLQFCHYGFVLVSICSYYIISYTEDDSFYKTRKTNPFNHISVYKLYHNKSKPKNNTENHSKKAKCLDFLKQ